jgi:hypothetical protein
MSFITDADGPAAIRNIEKLLSCDNAFPLEKFSQYLVIEVKYHRKMLNKEAMKKIVHLYYIYNSRSYLGCR